MDDLIKLICGCCSSQNDESDLPYRPLGGNEVMAVRDPPITNLNVIPNGHDNGAYDHTDSREEVFSDGLANGNAGRQRTDQEIERDLLEDILEHAQQNIIAVGQMDHYRIGSREMFTREKKYEELILQDQSSFLSSNPYVQDPHSSEYNFNLEFDATQAPIDLPLFYDDLSVSIPVNVAERPPFVCPNKERIRRARPAGIRTGKIIEEISDIKKAGKVTTINRAMRQKIKECAQAVHNGVEGLQIEHKTQLVVFMDL